ncbi:hypothetical protein [Nocardia alni]|uniref:hypothetical protein n=1 Tax=Nocardia alni TaxID=2815723 RepID=UPI001C250D44|nr:hypothetical protein [Nocardia alni]
MRGNNYPSIDPAWASLVHVGFLNWPKVIVLAACGIDGNGYGLSVWPQPKTSRIHCDPVL